MPKVYLDEITAALGSSTGSSLSKDSTESKSLNDSLTSYINESSNILKGTQWDKTREKMNQFNEALQARMELATELGNAIQKALTLLKDYLGEDGMLDTSQLSEYKTQRETCANSIAELNSMLKQTKQEAYTDASGNTAYREVKVYNTADIQKQIDTANETLKELDRLITKIEGLDTVYNQAKGILDEAFSGISTFQSKVSSITPSGIFTYKPAS